MITDNTTIDLKQAQIISVDKLLSITIPDSVKSIGAEAFEYCEMLTVRAPEGSYAEKYCVENEINVDIQK